MFDEFIKDLFGDKVAGLRATAETYNVLLEEAEKITGSVGEIGRAVMNGKSQAEVAKMRSCTRQWVSTCYERFLSKLRHPKHSSVILGTFK